MKKNVYFGGFIALFVFFFSSAAAQGYKSTPPGNANGQYSSVDPFPQTTFNINALGLLQFGPVFQAEFRVGQSGYFTPHLRIPYLGVLYHVINTDDDGRPSTVSPLALGIGAGYKKLSPTRHGAWYFGGVVEYSFGSSESNEGSDWKSAFSNIALLANAGYRWRWPNSRKVLSLGGYLGAYTALHDEWWYKIDPSDKTDERSTTPLAMVELSFGWQR